MTALLWGVAIVVLIIVAAPWLDAQLLKSQRQLERFAHYLEAKIEERDRDKTAS